MSKSLKLYFGAAAGTAVVLGTALIGANSAITYPETQVSYVRPEPKPAPVVETAKAPEAETAVSEPKAVAEAVKAPAKVEETAPVKMAEAEQAKTTATDASPEPVVSTQSAGVGANFGLGREALPEEIAAWNHDIMPDGSGLPVGSGDVWTGDEVFAEHCAVCHGDFAEGRDNWPKLAGGDGTLADQDPVKTCLI